MKIIALTGLFYTLALSHSFAQHTGMNAPLKEQAQYTDDKFKAHMLFHYNEGCPTNSECSSQMGKVYKHWSDTVSEFKSSKYQISHLESLRKKYGAPIDLWTTPKARAKDGFIYWDSPCRNHNQEGQEKIRIAVIMAQNISDIMKLETEGKVFIRRLYLLQENNQIKEYYSLRGENPLYLDGKNLVFKRMIEGHYYGLSIDPQGKLKMVKTLVPAKFPQTRMCPQEALKKVRALNHPTNLYSGIYCQKIWNIKKKSFETIYVGWSCN